MKKILILLISLLLLSGCTKKIEKFSLDAECYGDGIITDISADKLNEKVDNKENFAVFVYLSSCSSCSKFHTILDDFAEEYGINFYAISKTDAEDTTICECVKYSPSVTIYKDGEIAAFLDAASDDDLKYYESVEGFSNWFFTYVNEDYSE